MTSNWKNRVAKRFDLSAIEYEHNNTLQERVAQSLASTLPQQSNINILEIGCGTGALTQHLVNKYDDGEFYITDISEKMLQKAQEKFSVSENIKWSVVDGEGFESSKRYDLIVSSMAMQWFETPSASLKRLTQHLTPMGKLFYSVPSPHCFKEWRETLSNLSLPHGFSRSHPWPKIFKEEGIVIDYGTTLAFLQNLKKIGANIPDKDYSQLKASDLKQACAITDNHYQGKITWNILYGCISAQDL